MSIDTFNPVSDTHLDVYKRQAENAEDYRGPSDRKTKRLDLSERRDSETGRHTYRKRRNEPRIGNTLHFPAFHKKRIVPSNTKMVNGIIGIAMQRFGKMCIRDRPPAMY